MYTRPQTVWSLPGHSRQANKGHSPRCHRRPNGPGRLTDKVVQPTTQSAEGCTYIYIGKYIRLFLGVLGVSTSRSLCAHTGKFLYFKCKYKYHFGRHSLLFNSAGGGILAVTFRFAGDVCGMFSLPPLTKITDQIGTQSCGDQKYQRDEND